MAEIVQLIQNNIDALGHLESLIQASMASAEAEHAFASHLLTTVRLDRNSRQESSQRIFHELDELVHQLDGEVAHLGSSFDKLRSEIDSMGEQASASAQHLEHILDEAQRRTDAELKTVQATAIELRGSMNVFATAVDQTWEQAGHSEGAFLSTANTLTSEIRHQIEPQVEAAKAALLSTHHAFSQAVGASSEDAQGAMKQAITELEAHLLEYANRLEAAANEMLGRGTTLLTVDIGHEFDAVWSSAHDVLAGIEHQITELADILNQKVGQALDNIHAVLDLIESIRPVLDAVKQLS